MRGLRSPLLATKRTYYESERYDEDDMGKREIYAMNCWHCKTELIWGGDHDVDDNDDYVMETNLSCPKCNSLVLVMMAKETEDES
mgnify:CR=1 FL=1